MFTNKNIHNFKNYNNLLWAERLMIFKEKLSPSQKEALKKLEKIEKRREKDLKKARELRKALYEGKKVELKKKLKNKNDYMDLTRRIADKYPSKIRKDLIDSLRRSMAAALTGVDLRRLNKYSPVNISFEKGILVFDKHPHFRYSINIFEKDIRLLFLIEVEKKRREILSARKEDRIKLLDKVDAKGNLDKFIRPTHSKYLKKKGDVYIVDFKKGKRIDRKAEKETKLSDIFNFKGVNAYVVIEVKGKTSGGRSNNYKAYYHPAQGTFIIERTQNRAKIFHGNSISIVKYEPLVRKPKGAPKTAPGKPRKAAQVVPEKARKKPTKAVEELTKEERREEWMYNRDASLWNEYSRYIFENRKFTVPNFLQDDSDFERYWGRIDNVLEAELSRAPFNLRTSLSRRKYMQDVIQDYLNSRIYAEDFFKYKINGKDLYKGGYKKFMRDFAKLEKKRLEETLTDKEDEKLAQIEEIIFGIARVFDALKRVKLHRKKAETREDAYKGKLIGISEMSDKEKKEVKTISGTNFHSLESLLHKRENAPSGIALGATNAKLDELENTIKSAASDVPDFNIDKYLKGIHAKRGLKLLFMAFGFNELIRRGCIKKLDKKRYLLIKVPKQGWIGAFLEMRKQNPALWETTKSNFKKWERVRATLDSGTRARRFIAKIFSPSKTTVTQNLNWWKRLWHWEWKKEKKISMAYLGKATLNPRDFEKHLVEKRGYLDMMEKTSKRVEGTSIFQPQTKEVLTLTNRYLEYGLIATFMNVTDKNLPKVMKNVLRAFNLEGQVTIKKPLIKNKMENLRAIHNSIALKNLDARKLTSAHLKFIRLGYVLGRQVETAKNWSESLEGVLSRKPFYRKIQMEALKQGCPVSQLKEVAERIHIAIFGYSEGMKPPHVKAVGAAVAVRLGKWAGQSWHFTFAGVGTNGEFIPAAEIGATIRAGKKVKIRWGIGTTIGFTGAAAAIEFPVTSEWDMYLGAGAGVDWSGANVGVGAGIGARWNQRRAERLNERKALSERNVKEIQKFVEAGNVDKAAELILKHPTFGEYMTALKKKFDLPNSAVVDIYKQAEREWILKARSGVKIPVVVGFGAGVFFGINATTPALSSVGVGGYITFKIPGTTVNYVIRHEHPKFSEYVTRNVANEDLRRQLKKEQLKNTVISKHIIKAKSGILYFDAQLGRSHVARPKNSREAMRSLAVKGKEQNADLSDKSSFDAIKRAFLNVDIHVDKVKDPRNPKGFLIELTPLQIQGSNVEFLIDPDLRSKGIILDQKNNRILLAASDAKRLYISRTRYRYPFRRRGALNLDVISFKTDPDRSNIQIREDSRHYIYKYRGEKYIRVNGEARTGITELESNTITLQQYKNRKAKFETFIDHKYEYNINEGRSLTREMSKAVDIREIPEIRSRKLRIKKFAKEWFIPSNRKEFDRRIVSIDTVEDENALKSELFKEWQNVYKDFARKEGMKLEAGVTLNNAELNLIYNYILNESFVRLRKGGNDKIITKRLEKRNKLFENFIKGYIADYIENNPEQWNQIQQADPSITPESIANYLVLCMPQNAAQLRRFDAAKGLAIKGGLKFASYTRRLRKYESLPSSFGVDTPADFAGLFKILKPTRLNVLSTNPTERAAAKLILQMMSPVYTENLETLDGKAKFLTSELSLLMISVYDEKTGLSPLIQVLGKSNYKGMIEIYKALKNRAQNPEAFNKALENHKVAFNMFKELVTGIRNAQLNGDKTFIFKNKYIFHLEDTEIYSGPYLKCGNGTIAVRQRIGITTTEKVPQKWYAPKKKGYNILVQREERAKFASFTLGWAHGFKMKRKPRKGEPPDRHKEPPKGEVPDRHEAPSTPSTGGETPSGGGTQPPVSEGPSGSI